MMKYNITRNTDKQKLLKKMNLNEGYSFSQKLNIKVYNSDIIRFILKKKINNQIDKLMKMLILVDNADDDDSSLELYSKVETLKLLLFEKYSIYLSNEDIQLFLYKIGNIEDKINFKKNARRRH